MKNNRFGFLMILAFAALASSCGTSGYYATEQYNDGIYYRPTAASRAKMVAAQEALRERERQRQYDQYLAKDEDGNLYVVTELLDGETYESRLHKFDSPYYNNYVWHSYWDWDYPWWGSWRYAYSNWYWRSPWYDVSWYGHYPYYGWYSPYYSWGGWYSPWYWGAGYAGWYGWHHWHHWHHSPGHVHPGPGPRPDRGRNIVYTPRNSATGSGMYRTTGSGSVNGNRGMYTTRRTSTGGSVSTRTSTGTVRSSGTSRPVRTGSSRPVRTGSSGSSNYTRSSGSYSSGGSSRSGGGGSYSGGSSSSSGGNSVSGGNHSGGGRR